MNRPDNFLLTVVLPAYNEMEMIPLAADAIGAVLREADIRYELLFVCDGATDGTWPQIAARAAEDAHVRGVRLSRNFGKESAIFAGLADARGDCAVVMDCDLQHPPEAIPRMVAAWREGYDVVEGQKQSRGKESRLHGLAARAFYRVISRATGVDMMRASDFKLLDRRAIDAMLALPEQHRFFRALSAWIGFSSIAVPFDVQARPRGTSKWSSLSLLRYAFVTISSFSTAPMHMVTVLGAIDLLLALVIGIQTFVRWLMGRSLEGFTTVILLIMITSSIIMLSLGIIGFYIAKVYEQVRGRPQYIVMDRTAQRADTHFQLSQKPNTDQ